MEEYERIIKKMMVNHQHVMTVYVRVRQGLFFALSDVVDAFVVSGKHKREQSKQSRATPSSSLYVKWFPATASSST